MTDIRPGMNPRRTFSMGLLAATLLAAAPAFAQSGDYQARLAQYSRVHDAYEQEASAYWDQVVDKRRARNAKRRTGEPITAADYVLPQPPVYTGPPRPIDPNAPPGPGPGERPPIPVLADFLKAAVEQFSFVPDRPSELDFKRAYAQAAGAVG